MRNSDANQVSWEGSPLFAYDPKESLDAVVHAANPHNRCTVQELSYTSPMGGRVPASLVVPADAGPHAALIFMHPGQGNRTTYLSEAIALADAGVVALLVDAPYLRPGFVPAPGRPAGAFGPELYRQLVVDLRRGVDLVAGRPDVDPDRIGYVGHSLGATWGGPLAGVEKRIRACVLMAGYASLTEWHRTSAHPLAAGLRSAFTAEAFDQYMAELAPLDAVHYIGNATQASLLFQFASQDQFVPREQAEQYVAGASEPKEVRWYDTGHLFKGTAAPRLDRARWLQAALGLAALSDMVLERIAKAEPHFLWG